MKILEGTLKRKELVFCPPYVFSKMVEKSQRRKSEFLYRLKL